MAATSVEGRVGVVDDNDVDCIGSVEDMNDDDVLENIDANDVA